MLTLGLEVNILDLRGTWHELGIDIVLSAPACNQMAVLQNSQKILADNSRKNPDIKMHTCEPKSRIRIVSN
jgi:hypothetical protein